MMRANCVGQSPFVPLATGDRAMGKQRRVLGLCPVCGEAVRLTDTVTSNGRLVGTCGDSFLADAWDRCDNCGHEPCEGLEGCTVPAGWSTVGDDGECGPGCDCRDMP
jgi:hypothetical protein